MTTVNPNDKFAVNRDNKVYSVDQSTIMASLEFTDYLAVNRDDVTYKITGEEFISSVLDPLELIPVVTIIDGDTTQTATVSENAVGGKQPYTFDYSWRYQEANGNVVIIPGAPNTKSYVIPLGYYELGIGCYVTVTDSLSQTAAELSNFEKVAVAVNIQSVVLTENVDQGQRALTTSVITGVGEGSNNAGFAPVIYSGNGGTQSITGVGFSPDLVWTKTRNAANSHQLFDSVRGPNQRLKTDGTSEQSNQANSLVSFDSSGFTLGSNTNVNLSNKTYVAWCWDAGDTAAINNDGTIQSQVRSNGDFSIVTFNTGDTTQTIGHGLTSTPAFIITKSISASNPWICYHTSLGSDGYIYLSQTNAADTIAGYWGAPNSSTFGVPTSSGNNTGDMLAYCWSENSTQSFGSYTGNGLADGPVIDCGFEPAFVMIKCSSNSGDWTIYDTARDSDVLKTYLEPNTSDAESNVGSDGVNDGVNLTS